MPRTVIGSERVAPGRGYTVTVIQAPAPSAQVGQGDEGGTHYRQIQDDLNDLTRLLAFKEKRILQAEAG